MTIIIGIDPGSRMTGYGVIQCKPQQSIYLTSGCLKLTGSNLADRLHQLHSALQKIIQQYSPQEAAIEQVFMHKNANSALKLGQARGAAIVGLGSAIQLAEYSARQVKQSVVGFGAAKKEQVQHMVQKLLTLTQPLQADEADALAIALCHAHFRAGIPKALLSARGKKSSWRHYQPTSAE